MTKIESLIEEIPTAKREKKYLSSKASICSPLLNCKTCSPASRNKKK
jgi:hypothetical protein